MKKKEPDIFDILEPAKITITTYEDATVPFSDDNWVDSGDLTILEIARLLPYQLPFVYNLLHECPNLLPVEKQSPGRFEQLIFADVMERLKNRTRRDYKLERKIQHIWKSSGGYIESTSKKVVKNGKLS